MSTRFKKDCLMEIYTEHDEYFSIGFYLYSFDKYSLFHLLDEQGKTDGVYLIKNDFIKNIDYDTAYLKKMRLYSEFWKENTGEEDFLNKISLEKFSEIDDVLKYIKKNDILSSFRINSEEYMISGHIKFIDKMKIKIQEISIETAEELDIMSFIKDDILLLEIESVNNRLLNYAYLKN